MCFAPSVRRFAHDGSSGDGCCGPSVLGTQRPRLEPRGHGAPWRLASPLVLTDVRKNEARGQGFCPPAADPWPRVPGPGETRGSGSVRGAGVRAPAQGGAGCHPVLALGLPAPPWPPRSSSQQPGPCRGITLPCTASACGPVAPGPVLLQDSYVQYFLGALEILNSFNLCDKCALPE